MPMTVKDMATARRTPAPSFSFGGFTALLQAFRDISHNAVHLGRCSPPPLPASSLDLHRQFIRRRTDSTLRR